MITEAVNRDLLAYLVAKRVSESLNDLESLKGDSIAGIDGRLLASCSQNVRTFSCRLV